MSRDIGRIKKLLRSKDHDRVFHAVSILPELPDSARGALQQDVLCIVYDPDMPEDVRKAAAAENVGYKRRVGPYSQQPLPKGRGLGAKLAKPS